MFYIENASGWQTDSTSTEYWYENGYRRGYDANGEAVYYFDPIYGTMAKVEVTIKIAPANVLPWCDSGKSLPYSYHHKKI